MKKSCRLVTLNLGCRKSDKDKSPKCSGHRSSSLFNELRFIGDLNSTLVKYILKKCCCKNVPFIHCDELAAGSNVFGSSIWINRKWSSSVEDT